MILSENFKDLRSAKEAFKRVQAEKDAVASDTLSPMNVDLVSATAIVLGMADGIIALKGTHRKVARVRHEVDSTTRWRFESVHQ